MLGELVSTYHSAINQFFNQLDLSSLEEIFKVMRGCEGKLCFGGVGKSAVVARKIAMTMVSTGTPAAYVSVVDALHGDIGQVGDKDIFTFLSKSGETEELLNLAPHLRNKGAKLIAVVSKANSRLAKVCHHQICLPVAQELCPFNLAPTTSSTIQMIFGDLMTIALMRDRQFTLDQYALNHPAGQIGKRITLRVSDLMVTGSKLPQCRSTDKILDVLGELSSKACGCILVVDETGVLQGIFTDGDLRRALQTHGSHALERSLGEVMTKNPRCIHDHSYAWDALKIMESKQSRAITVLPVTDDQKRLIGLVHMHHILQSGL